MFSSAHRARLRTQQAPALGFKSSGFGFAHRQRRYGHCVALRIVRCGARLRTGGRTGFGRQSWVRSPRLSQVSGCSQPALVQCSRRHGASCSRHRACLTIHSSRRRFAARLNSGVRSLRAMLPQLCPAACRRNSPTGCSVGFLALCSNLVQRLVLASTSPGARGLSRQQTRKHSRPPQRFLAALLLCARATRLSDGTGNCVQPLALRSRARLSRSSATLRPNKSFKPTPLRGAA